MDGVKEMLCTTCIHRQVCAHIEDFEKLFKTAEKMKADANYNDMFRITFACYCYQSEPKVNIR